MDIPGVSNDTYLTMRGAVHNGTFLPSQIEISHYPDRRPTEPGSVEEAVNEMHTERVIEQVAEFLSKE